MDGVDLDTARLLVCYMAGKPLRVLEPLTLTCLDDPYAEIITISPGEQVDLDDQQHVPSNLADNRVHLKYRGRPVMLRLDEFALAFCLAG